MQLLFLGSPCAVIFLFFSVSSIVLDILSYYFLTNYIAVMTILLQFNQALNESNRWIQFRETISFGLAANPVCSLGS